MKQGWLENRIERKPPPEWLHLAIGVACYAGVLCGYVQSIYLGIGLEIVFWLVYCRVLLDPAEAVEAPQTPDACDNIHP